MSLLQKLPYKQYMEAKKLSEEDCLLMARIAKIGPLRNKYNGDTWGETLVKAMDRAGFDLKAYHDLIEYHAWRYSIPKMYSPQCKLAFMIANERYENLSNLVTPQVDCKDLANCAGRLGFSTMTLVDLTADALRRFLTDVIAMLPEDSYCLIYYAGHGCQLGKTQCMLGVDCPTKNVGLEHCVTENFLLRELGKRKPDQIVMILDMCRVHLEKDNNHEIYSSKNIEEYTVHKNLITTYSAQDSQSAYEMLQIECTTEELDESAAATYELKTGDTDRIVPGSSVYATVLKSRIMDVLDISTLFDEIHSVVEESIKKQRPIKVQCGTERRCLFDLAIGDVDAFDKMVTEYIKSKDTIHNCRFKGGLL